ncbi:MAG: winged helix-turn-helix domain-containing protein [Pseudomonadota bacterium]
MSGTEHERYLVGDWTLTRRRNLLSRDGTEHSLEPRAVELLAFLAQRPGEVVSIDLLLSDLWPDRVVTESSVYRLIAELRRTLGDDARAPRYIETVRKRGYRMVAACTAIVQTSAPSEPSVPTPPATDRPTSTDSARHPGRMAGLAVLGLSLLTLLSWRLTRDAPAPPAQPAVVLAVLPVEALSPMAADWLTDGIARTLTDRLSAIPELSVIAWPSVREAAEEAASAGEIAERVGANLLLSTAALVDDGDGRRVRLNAALIRPATGVQLWASSFDGNLSDLFALHDRLSGEIARELDLRLFADARSAALNAPADTMQAYLRGEAALARGYQADNLSEAIAYFDIALEGSPKFLPAVTRRAIAHARLYANYHDRTEQRLGLARQDVERALALAPTEASTRFANGYLLLANDDHAQASPELRDALARQPSNASILSALAEAEVHAGDGDKALIHASQAVRLDPLNPLLHYNLGIKQLNAGRFAEGDASMQRAQSLDPAMVEPYFYRAWTQVSWLADTAAANQHLHRLRVQIGDDMLIDLLLSAGLWGVFTWTDPTLNELLSTWSTADSGGDPATWHLAMAEIALRRGDESARQDHYRAAAEQRERDIVARDNSPWLHAELAIAYAGQGLRTLALETADRAIALSPARDNPWDGADFLWIRAMVLSMLGDIDEAIDQVREAAIYPNLTTPNSLLVDENWSMLFEVEAFRAMVSDDGARWVLSP